MPKALLERVACPRYVVSANGAQFGHPDAEAISRLILQGGDAPQLVCNCKPKYGQRNRGAPEPQRLLLCL